MIFIKEILANHKKDYTLLTSTHKNNNDMILKFIVKCCSTNNKGKIPETKTGYSSLYLSFHYKSVSYNDKLTRNKNIIKKIKHGVPMKGLEAFLINCDLKIETDTSLILELTKIFCCLAQ